MTEVSAELVQIKDEMRGRLDLMVASLTEQEFRKLVSSIAIICVGGDAANLFAKMKPGTQLMIMAAAMTGLIEAFVRKGGQDEVEVH